MQSIKFFFQLTSLIYAFSELFTKHAGDKKKERQIERKKERKKVFNFYLNQFLITFLFHHYRLLKLEHHLPNIIKTEHLNLQPLSKGENLPNLTLQSSTTFYSLRSQFIDAFYLPRSYMAPHKIRCLRLGDTTGFPMFPFTARESLIALSQNQT